MSNFTNLSILADLACRSSSGDTNDFEEVQTARMPIIPSVSNEAMRTGVPALPDGQLNTEEEQTAEENMRVYLKPVNYYSLLQGRATAKTPSFLPRSLCFKLEEKHTKKVQLSVSISEAIGKTIFPVYILLARRDPTHNGETLRSSSYRFKKAIKLTASDGTQAKFTLPEIEKLSARVKDRSFSLLLVSGADHANPNEMDRTKDHMLTLCKMGDCVMGKVLIDDLLHLSLGEKLQSRSVVSMQSCRMKVTSRRVVTFQFPYNRESVQVPVVVTAEEFGAKATDNNLLANLLPPGLGLKPGEVTFRYKGSNDIVCMSEVMPDYACPFCFLASASFKGLKCHLQASHDLFDYDFQEDAKYKVVIVSYNKMDALNLETFGILTLEDLKFFFRHKAAKRMKIAEDQTQPAHHLGHVTLG